MAQCAYDCCSELFPVVQNAVTGEHTCMILKPLNNDDIDVSGSDELGFFGPFYRGPLFSAWLILFLIYTMLSWYPEIFAEYMQISNKGLPGSWLIVFGTWSISLR